MTIYRYLIEIEYLGKHYSGWQKQGSLPTIQGVLEEKIAIVLRYQIALHVAGRTDAGVHAYSQYAHFDAFTKIELNKFIYSINSLLKDAHTIAIKSIKPIDNNFHARFSCKQKTYIYNIWASKVRNMFLPEQCWHTPKIVDIDEFVSKANECAQYLIGTHDFSSFRDGDCQAKSAIRSIDECMFSNSGNMITMHIKARSFLHHQVRITIGTIYDVIMQNQPNEYIKEILQARDRRQAGCTAPAHGLFLKEVVY